MSHARYLLIGVTLVLFAVGTLSASAAPVGTAFTYQGKLSDGGVPANGTFDLEFTLWDAAAAGSQIGSPITREDVTVTSGIFVVTLDFGNTAFTGSARWLAIGVRPGASSDPFTALSARQELTPTPNAIQVPWSGLTGVPAGFADGVDDTGSGSGSGTVTSVGTGAGLTGGPITTSGTIAVSFGTTSTTVATGDHNHFGQSWSGSGYGLEVDTSTTIALQGVSSGASGRGVYGLASSTTGGNTGVWGRSNSSDGVGVKGVAAWAGVHGDSSSSSGFGVLGTASSTTGANNGVQGETVSTGGIGVSGRAWATEGYNYGVFGESASTTGRGVSGRASATTGQSSGVTGESRSDVGQGVFGLAIATTGANYGVRGNSWSSSGYGVAGFANASTGVNYGVFGQSSSTSGYAGFFAGNVTVTGTFSKPGGSFKIDHPLDPENKYLYHSFVESPDMKNIYDGVVTTGATGLATVDLPNWFDALNRDFRYQLTVVGNGAWARARIFTEIVDNRFVIQTDIPSVKVSWQVTGIRKDAWAEAHRISVEEDKKGDEKGTYLHPEALGQPKEMGLDFKRSSRNRSELQPIASPPQP